MSGLFVQKHVEAVRAFGCEVRVICSSGWADMWRQWKALQREGWRPDVVQLNVIQKQGLLAMWLKRRFHIPYIIVEHWSGYLPQNGQFLRMPRLTRWFYRRIAQNAEYVLTVSLPLQRAMQACGIAAREWGTIDNVVDSFFFETSTSRDLEVSPITNHQSPISNRKVLLYVSCFDEKAKNVKGLLRAAKMLSMNRQDWRLVLVGTGVDYDDVRAFAKTLDMPENLLEWTGELTPEQVAQRMHNADALVLSSRYETYGVVLAEAAAAGLPILSTPVGIAEETGALIVPQEVAQNKPGKFAEFIETILWNQPITNHQSPITNHQSPVTHPFTADAIGRKLLSVYEQVQSR